VGTGFECGLWFRSPLTWGLLGASTAAQGLGDELLLGLPSLGEQRQVLDVLDRHPL
jgi:hypothetical protein